MRFPALSVVLLTVLSCASAGPVLLTFSGTMGSNCPPSTPTCSTTGVGVVMPGDAFSGAAVWDPATIGSNPSFPTYALFTAFNLTFPSADGLTVAGIPSAQVIFAGTNFTGGNPATPLVIQVNVKSTADNNVYVLFIAPTPQSCGGPTCGFDVSNAGFTQGAFSNTFNSSLIALPEPGTGGIVLTGLGLVGALAWMRKRRKYLLAA